MKFLSITIITLIISLNLFSQSKIDSINSTLDSLDKVEKIYKLNEKYLQYKYNNPKLSIEICQLAIQYADEINIDTLKIQPLINIGIANYYLSQFDSIQIYLEKAESICKQEKYINKNNIKQYEAQIWNLRGIKEFKLGNYEQAINDYLNAEKIFWELEEKPGLAKVYNNIALIYRKISNYPKALSYYLKSIKLHEELKDSSQLGSSYNNVAILYSSNYLNNIDSFLFYTNKSIEINKATNNKRLLSINYQTLGSYYKRKQNYEKALSYLNKSLKLKKEINYLSGISYSYSTIAEVYIILKKSEIAKKYIDSIKQSSFQRNDIEMIISYYNLSYRLDSLNNNYQSAFNNLYKYNFLQDSLIKTQTSEKINELELKYLKEKKDKEIQIRDLKLEKNQEQIKRRNIAIYAFILIIILITISLWFIFKQNKKIRLSYKLLEEQNVEINHQKEEITIQRDYIIEKNKKIEQQNKDIKGSISYAARIQAVLLTQQETINRLLPNNFILFKPRDIVSGDFYWAEEIEGKDRVIYATADCTGHGVPGAFMSLLGISFLKEILSNYKNKYSPAEIKTNMILNQLRFKIKEALLQKDDNSKTKDGMDMVLCIIDYKKMELDFTGANNPILIVNKNEQNFEIEEIKGERMPVGIYYGIEKNFKNKIIKLQNKSIIYSFSDGFIDQFGGQKNQKYYKSNLKKFILSIQDKNLNEQKEAFELEFKNWKGNINQTDDIIIMAVAARKS